MTESLTRYLTFRGNNKALIESRDIEIGLAGAAGTGKSVACLFKLHARANKYPGSRHLITRMTRKSMTQSTMITLQQNVFPPRWKTVINWHTDGQEYRYPNGSILAVTGMDDPETLKSSEWDTIYVQEASEVTEDRFDILLSRLRFGSTPYHQLIYDTNPGAPTHWLKKRADRGASLMLPSVHEDNPRYYDEATQTWTPEGRDYITNILDKLTGVRYERLRLGKWAAAEGLVYEGFSPVIHIVDPFPIPSTWPRFRAIDFGYRNPTCVKHYALSPDSQLVCYRELYVTGTLVQDIAQEVLRLEKGEPRPVATICDHDAEDRATFERHTGDATTAAYKDVKSGIEAVQARLRVGGNGKPGIVYFRDMLVRRDPALEQKKLPIGTFEEYDSYVWDTSARIGVKEAPVKANDHAMDTDRYMIAFFDLQPRQPSYAYATRPAPLFSQQNRHV